MFLETHPSLLRKKFEVCVLDPEIFSKAEELLNEKNKRKLSAQSIDKETKRKKTERQGEENRKSSTNLGSPQSISPIPTPDGSSKRDPMDNRHLGFEFPALAKREDDKVLALVDAWEGLPTLSAPKDEALLEDKRLHKTYFHYKNPGEGVVVYVYDIGFNLDNEEFRDLQLQEGVLRSGDLRFDFLSDIAEHGDHHGGLMIDKIAGKYAGIAQRARIVIATMVEGAAVITFFSQIGALLSVYDDIMDRYVNLDIPCIINFSVAFTLARFDRDSPDIEYGDKLAGTISDIFSKLMDLDNVIIVSAAGNGKPGKPINTYPARLGLDLPDRKNQVVVGGTRVDGLNMFQYDTNMPNFVWAPGENVWVYGHKDPNTIVEPVSGTSLAAAAVSGMLAMYISRDIDSNTRTEDAVTKLKTLSWKRNPNGVPIIHNGITPDQWPAAFEPIDDMIEI
ncbi:hypothetical protein TWF506_006175 [Arthrobotrys conoides]|uniref:Peptidase S8/S53 domain-containing protein n=1 Tax=Arthrobotrys conoides TaxID=74498 RepID=A0AAN8NGD6_9PEZI